MLRDGCFNKDLQVNPDYKDIFVFDNDFPSLSMNYTLDEQNKIRPQDIPAHGICRVVCFSPKHNITLCGMDEEEVVKIVPNKSAEELRSLSTIHHTKNS